MATTTTGTRPFVSMPVPSAAYMPASHDVRRRPATTARRQHQRVTTTAAVISMSGLSVRASSTKPTLVMSATPATMPASSP